MLQNVGIAFDSAMVKHEAPCGYHPENPTRIMVPIKNLRDKNLFDICKMIRVVPAKRSILELTHTRAYIKEIKQRSNQPALSSGDMYWNAHTYKACKSAAGAVIEITKKCT